MYMAEETRVLGGDQHRLHPPAHGPSHRSDDRGCVERRLLSEHRANAGLEGPRLDEEGPRGTQLPRQPRPRISDLRNVLLLLRSSTRHPHPLLEDLPDGQEEDSQEKKGERAAQGRPRGQQRFDGPQRWRGGGSGCSPGGRGAATAHDFRGHDHNHHDGFHQRVLRQQQPREDFFRQRSAAGPHHGLRGRVPGSSRAALPQAEEDQRLRRLQEGEEGGEDAGHHNGRLRGVLAALLHRGHPPARLHHLLLQRLHDGILPLARILQLNAQSPHLHHLQP
ncbi:hypothetical protein J437_LFUL012055 [Ladona fulva]|uniref:Uncharacterized protein n=1 Tax=Ladona fulva TaxID=123851 RepID=A0A8K0KDD8_LADFU|nr:hypothetical protein J437_LFUL012055 [Ladona fulva]